MNRERIGTFIVGDGFSRSAINHLNLQETIVTRPLFPPPVEVPIPPEDRRLAGITSLSDPLLFPDLWQRWNIFVNLNDIPANTPRDMLFFDELRSEAVNPDLVRYLVSTKGNYIGNQLRAYLFYLFRYYNAVFMEQRKNRKLESWLWLHVLVELQKRFFFTFPSVPEWVKQLRTQV